MLERCGGFYSPPRESSHWGIKNPDLSRSGAGLVRVGGRTCPTNHSGNRLGDRICPVQDFVTKELDLVGHVETGGGQVWEIPLESILEAGYAWLTREKAERSNMSGLGAGHVWPESRECG
jgi:hypothetical protein